MVLLNAERHILTLNYKKINLLMLIIYPFTGYPCLCLCLGFVQITITLPLRLITRQFLQIRFADAPTFMILPHPIF